MSIYPEIFESLKTFDVDHELEFRSLQHISSTGFPARSGWNHTEESKEKIRARAKMPRVPLSEETKNKISKANIGKGHSQSKETRKKISEGSKKRPLISEETRRKISESAKNRKPSLKRRTRKSPSKETKKKISDTLKARNSLYSDSPSTKPR